MINSKKVVSLALAAAVSTSLMGFVPAIAMAEETATDTTATDTTATDTAATETTDPETAVVTDFGQVTIKTSGKKMIVTLNENASTGYSWTCKVTGNAVKKPKVKHQTAAVEEGLVGAPGTVQYTFNLKKNNTNAVIKFTYKSPAGKAAQSIQIKVKSTKKGVLKVVSKNSK